MSEWAAPVDVGVDTVSLLCYAERWLNLVSSRILDRECNYLTNFWVQWLCQNGRGRRFRSYLM